jgi:hypothetical protein
MRFDAVSDVADSQVAYGRQQRVRIVQIVDDVFEHGHELLGLRDHVALEQVPQRGIDGEQLGVEGRGHMRAKAAGARERALDEFDLVCVHFLIRIGVASFAGFAA